MRKCIACGAQLEGNPLLQYKNMPAAAQGMPEKSELQNEHGIDLELYQCNLCGLIQFDCEPVDYYKEVIRAGGFTTTMVELRRKQYQEFIKKFSLEQKRIIEIGAGQGEFLSLLNEFNVKAYGIEYSQSLVQIAREKNLTVFHGFVENENYIIDGAPYDAFVCFNYLEHQPNPNGMMRGIFNNLTENGVGLITVPDFQYILDNNGFYELIRDHLAYYTWDTLRFLVEKNGFQIIDKTIINRDTISISVRKRKKIDVTKLAQNYISLRKQLHKFFDELSNSGMEAAVWGAGHQAFTLLATMELENKVSYIIDSAPFKQGKYSPSTHIPIVSPDYYFKHKVGGILIAAPGYSEEIMRSIRERYAKDIHIALIRSERLEFIQ
ncbi:class I SAM-dependent methyltransferase [Christensenella tenuis]|jgi:2-polyprenyl-3-methyl-5-hydroxy-6-metoxy-1,4-benzoquinol methylase|uniref:Methyltransferase domain-containing protein n=1 Tax=Christensenella tenuis TaxID=2763033 RepID=A0ABR7EDK3_9FIRM|nr:class I SAM-dependent methyltransferase [Christensenella tenuis]MBC5647861.1 methyltransferase domain-containing protein [Christensenella tenuis]